MGFFERLGFKKKETVEQGLEKSREGLLSKLGKVVMGKDQVDDEVLDQLEEVLVTSDVGVSTTLKIIDKLQARVKRDKYVSTSDLHKILREEVSELLKPQDANRPADFDAEFPNKPHVIMVVGVNGVGKTTTIGKLASMYRLAGKSVLLGAADTFRAAAVSQLTVWSERAGVGIIQQGQGADPASVAFDAVQAAEARNVDVLIVDTAGRLHNKLTLMNELGKIKRVMSKVIDTAPHEVILVLDGSTGQNAILQAKAFTQVVDITGLAITKLDGTAKGGIVIAISDELSVPVKYIGVGEKIGDLQVFDREAFVDALFGERL
jgi:fused signal recognition particle receptor